MSLIHIALDGERSVSALLTEAPDPFAFLVLAHGVGAGMRHHFLQSTAEALTRHGVSVLRYQFPYMEAGSKRPDSPNARCGRLCPPAPSMPAPCHCSLAESRSVVA